MQLRLQKREWEKEWETHPRIMRIYVIFILGRQCIHTEKDMQKAVATTNTSTRLSKLCSKNHKKKCVNYFLLYFRLFSVILFKNPCWRCPIWQLQVARLHSNWIKSSLARSRSLSLSLYGAHHCTLVRRLLESKSNRQSKRNCRVERTCWSFAVACFGGARSSSSVCAFAFAVANSHRLVARQPWQLQATQVLHVN